MNRRKAGISVSTGGASGTPILSLDAALGRAAGSRVLAPRTPHVTSQGWQPQPGLDSNSPSIESEVANGMGGRGSCRAGRGLRLGGSLALPPWRSISCAGLNSSALIFRRPLRPRRALQPGGSGGCANRLVREPAEPARQGVLGAAWERGLPRCTPLRNRGGLRFLPCEGGRSPARRECSLSIPHRSIE